MTEPRRVQLRRTKGWRMPPNTVKVSRPSKWGNPFVVGRMYHHTDPLFAYIVATAPELGSARSGWTLTAIQLISARQAIIAYDRWLCEQPHLMASLGELRGKNLACWCKLDDDCHADVLLEILS